MGVCISIVNKSNTRAPIGEWNGYAGNKALFHELADLPSTYIETGDLGDVIVRPTDFKPWRNFVVTLPYNVEHFTEILDHLERDPDLYLNFCY